MKLSGKIIAADATDRTITIKCDEPISGIQICGRVVINDEYPDVQRVDIERPYETGGGPE